MKEYNYSAYFIVFNGRKLWPSALMSDAHYKREERRELKSWEFNRCSVTYYG